MVKKAIAFALLLLAGGTLRAQQSGLAGPAYRVTDYPGADAGSKMKNCILALPSTGGTCDARGLEGPQTITSDPFAGVSKPGVVILGETTFSVRATINVPSSWTIQGSYGGKRFAGGVSGENKGTVFLWAGASASNILRIFDVHHVLVQNITVDGASIPGMTGILIDSDNKPGTHHVVIENFNIYRCLTGIQWGSGALPDIPAYEVDKVQIFNGHIESGLRGSRGIVVQGANKGQDSKIEAVTMTQVDTGIDLSGGYSYFNIKNCSFGTPVTRGQKNPGIKSIGVANLIVESGSSESGSPAGHGDAERLFIYIPSSPYNSGSQTTVLLNTRVNEPILVEGTVKVLSVGNASGTQKTVPISSIRRTGDVVTVITAAPHRLAVGGAAIVSGVTEASLNGTFLVTATPSPNECSYSQAGPNAYDATGTLLPSLAVAHGGPYLSVTSIGDYLNNGQGWSVLGNPRVLKLQENLSSFPADATVAGLLRARTVVAGVNAVAFSPTPTFDASLGNTQEITLRGSVTSSSLTNAVAGQTINFIICQDASGPWTFVWPRNVKGAMTIGAAPSRCSSQAFVFDGTNAYALSSGIVNMEAH